MMPLILIALTTVAFIIIVVLLKKNDSVQKRLKISLKKAQEKYAEDIAKGDVIVEAQTEKHIYSVILRFFLAVLAVIICEGYLFDKFFNKVINSCELFLGISSFYWVILILSVFFIMTLFFLCFVWSSNYKRVIKTGYSHSNESGVFIKVRKKENPKSARIKMMGGIMVMFVIGVMMLNSVIRIFFETDKKMMSYQLIKDKSQEMQLTCLAKSEK